jgi:transcription termination factor NusG
MPVKVVRRRVIGAAAKEDVRWYVVHTERRAQSRVVVHLGRQRICIFCPCVRKLVHHRRKATCTHAPQFRAIFAPRSGLYRERWRSVNGFIGIVRLIMRGDVPQPARPGVVDSLHKEVSLNGVTDWTPLLKPTHPMRIRKGLLVHVIGRPHQVNAPDRARVFLSFLRQSTTVTLNREAFGSVT